MKTKSIIVVMAILFGFILVASAFTGGFITSRLLDSQSISSSLVLSHIPGLGDAQTTEAQPSNSIELFKPFWQAWEVVHKRYVNQPVDDTLLMRGAIKGMLDALDDNYTSYLDPEMTKQFEASLSGEYEGIGAWVDSTAEYLTIISAMAGSPAEKAGLKAGDQIVAIDGEDMTGIDGELVRQRVIGPRDTKVTLTILREGVAQPFDVEVTRGNITVPSVEGEIVENDIAYVKLNFFGEKTTQELRQTLKTLMAQNPTGLILDLRNNGGGYRDVAIEVASEFIDDGVVMYEEYADGTKDSYQAQSGGQALDIPMIVLINEGSASASEIVAGAIQDLQRGQLVGVTSFGKGSVQSLVRLVNEQGQMRVTIARWLTPDGRQINGVGLAPDLVIERSNEDIEADRDPQLDKAIQLLKK